MISTAYLIWIVVGRYIYINTLFLFFLEILSILSLVFLIKKNHKHYIYIFLISFFLLGLLIFNANENRYENNTSPKFQRQCNLTGTINSPISCLDNNLSFTILPESNKFLTNKNILVEAYNISKPNNYKYGQIVECNGYFKNLNYFDKNKEFYLKSKNIQGILSVNNEKDIYIRQSTSSSKNKFINIIFKIKDKLTNIQTRTLPYKHAQILNSLVYGTTSSNLNKDIKNTFINIGLIHLLVVSGAQVSIIISLITMLNKFFKFNRFITFFIISFFNFSFALLTGAEPSILRAAIMAETMLVSDVFNRSYDSLISLSAVAFILTLINPYLIFNISFQLSFIATISIIYGVPIISQKLKLFFPDYIAYILAISIAPSIMTFPIIGYYFNRISIISVLSNILVLPWIEILVILGFIASLIGQVSLFIAQLINNFNSILISVLLFLTNNLNKINFATINISQISIFKTIILYVFIFYLFEKIKLGFKDNLAKIFIIFFIALNLIIWPNAVTNISDSVANQKSNQLKITFLDVGQGDAIFIKALSGRNTLIDGGPKTKETNYTKEVVYKYLKKEHVKKIDVLILTHAHADHLGDLKYIIEKIPVGIILDPGLPHTSYLYKNFLKTIKNKKIPYRKAHIGQKLDYLNGIKGYILHPSKTLISGTKSDLNNNCIVFKLVYNKTSYIFLGDLEKEGEEMLFENNCPLHADIIKVAHHGSRNGNSELLLDKINPKIAIISCGKYNSYGNPHKETIDRLKKRNIKIYRTDQNGAITVYSDGQNISFKN